MITALPFVLLLIIGSSVIFVLENPGITTGTPSNPNCALVKKGASLHGLNLSFCNLSGANLKGANLHNANLTGANLQNANLQNVNLSGANLRNADLSGANLRNANLHNANLAGTHLNNANLIGANLRNTKLQNYQTGVNIVNEVLTGGNIKNATVQNANIIISNISDENQTEKDTQNATVQNANLTGTSLAIASITNSISVDSAVANSSADSTSADSSTGSSSADSSADSTSTNPVNDNSVNTANISEMLTIQTVGSYPVPGASYTITPSPKTGTGILLVTDGGFGDDDGINDGLIKLSKVYQGSYVIKQVTIPSGFSSLLDSTTININAVDQDTHVTFQVAPTSTALSTLPSTPITSPSLNNDTFTQWTKTFSATIVNNGNSSSISNVDQTPQVIVVGTQNSTAIDAAVNSQSSVVLDTTFAPLTKGSSIINTMGLENYTLPNSVNVVSVVPTILAQVNSTTDYVAATPPFSQIVPGQQMIIPMSDSLLPSFGGLKQIDVQSSPTAQPVGEANTEWLVAEVDNKIPSSINSSGIDGTPVMFVNIQHPYEETGSGFNWSDPANHAVPPQLTLVINKDNSTDIQQDANGCPVVIPYTLVSDSWTTTGVTELSSKSVSTTQCEITIQSQHLSKFTFSLQHLSTLYVTQSSGDTHHTTNYLKPASAVEEIAPDTITNNPLPVTESLTNVYQIPDLEIPLWVKDNAKSWHDGTIDDSNFALGVQYMMQQNIIKTPGSLSKNFVGETPPKIVLQEIPSWVKNNAYWWSQGQISNYEYVNGIQWLISNQIIKMM